jgi:hypothetical protein
MNRRPNLILLIVLLAIAFVPSAQGQRGGFRGGRSGRGSARMQRASRLFDGGGFAPFYANYDDYDSGPGTQSPSLNVAFVQPPQPTPPAVAPKPSDSLVIELQGDHWVRVTEYGRLSTESSDAARRAATNAPPAPLPPAVLVFRDGHHEEIGKYLINGSTIYANADYWSGGTWTRKVQIAELDVPATLKLNQERGAKFSLPSGPNEVMVRP